MGGQNWAKTLFSAFSSVIPIVFLRSHFFVIQIMALMFYGLPSGTRGKETPANAGDLRDVGSVPGLARSPGGRNGNPLQYSCWENPMDKGAWWATVHGVAKSWTRLKLLSMHALLSICYWILWEFLNHLTEYTSE